MIARLATYAIGISLLCLLAVPVLMINPSAGGMVHAAEGLDINTATAEGIAGDWRCVCGEDHHWSAVQSEG